MLMLCVCWLCSFRHCSPSHSVCLSGPRLLRHFLGQDPHRLCNAKSCPRLQHALCTTDSRRISPGSRKFLFALQRRSAAVSHHLLVGYQRSLVEVIRAQQGPKAAPGGFAVRLPCSRSIPLHCSGCCISPRRRQREGPRCLQPRHPHVRGAELGCSDAICAGA